MDEIKKIKKQFTKQGKNRNQLAKEFHRSWNTIATVVDTPIEELAERGKRPGRIKTVCTDEVRQRIHQLFDQEELYGVKRKQRYTSQVIFKILKQEGVFQGADRTLRNLVKEIRLERRCQAKSSYLPLSFPAGSTLQVDPGEVDVVIDGIRMKAHMFVASIPGLAIRYCQAYPVKSQEVWGDFHERAFRFFGGVFPRLIYDNDSVLIKEVIGTSHKQTQFSLALEEHYGFQSDFCNAAAGNEKGAVENGVGYCRRNYFAGLSEYASFMVLNRTLAEQCDETIQNGTHYRTQESLKSVLEEVRDLLLPLLPEREWQKWSEGLVNGYQLVTYGKHNYSVPERYVGGQVKIGVSAFNIRIYQDNQQIAKHVRCFQAGDDGLQLDHYLEQLLQKPGALWDTRVMQESRLSNELYALWDRLAARLQRRQANREFIKILFLRRHYSEDDFATAIGLALEYGATTYDGVANIIKQLTTAMAPRCNAAWVKEWFPDLDPACVASTSDLSVYGELCQEVAHVA